MTGHGSQQESRIERGRVLADLDAFLSKYPPGEMLELYAALQTRVWTVMVRMLKQDQHTDAQQAPRKRFFRVREVMELAGLSKGKIFQALKEGKLDGWKLDGVLIISVESVERYLASATPWKPNDGSNEN